MGRDLRRARRRALRRHRQPGLDQPRARGEVPLQRAVHRLARRHRRAGGRRLDHELRRPRGKTTAQSLTSNWYELAEESGATVEAVEGWAQAVALLQQGRVDATINDNLTFLDYEKSEGPTGLKIAAETDDPAYNAFAFTKDKEALVEAIDEALAELREEGVLAEISEKYFGADVTSHTVRTISAAAPRGRRHR